MDEMQLIGSQLAQYTIEEHLGQGGMGSVYRAWDTRLRRAVAIKILRAAAEQPGTSPSGHGRARFLMEARAAAALNHPNIVTIYEIGEIRSLDYIAMELVHGSTLFNLIRDKHPLPLEAILSYAVQIADAVAAAHAIKITHRDLKPANIMVTEKGLTKILDFGIAKRHDPVGASDETLTMGVVTQFGQALGTPNYMSPEQAEGKPVDGRSDIFAIGAVMYEMLTGRRAFPGNSTAAVMAAILREDPPPISTVRPVPEDLERVVARCLRKDVTRRLQHADDLKIQIEEILSGAAASVSSPSGTVRLYTAGAVASLSTYSNVSAVSGAVAGVVTPSPSLGSATVAGAQPPRSRKSLWIVAGSVVAAAAITAGVWAVRAKSPSVPKLGGELTRVTSERGLAGWPALSRDGKFIAYASDRPDEKNLHIWLQQIGGGQPIQLTKGNWDDTEPDFSPDGTKIVFRSGRDGSGIYVVPTLGGEPRPIAEHGRRPRFSPDGTKIAYWVGGGLGKSFIVDSAGGSEPQPLQPEFAWSRYPLWSPDGKLILFEGAQESDDGPPAAGQRELWWVAPVDGGAAIRTGLFFRLRALDIFPDLPSAWLSGDVLLFAGLKDRSLWSVQFSPKGSNADVIPERLTFGTNTDTMPAAAGDGTLSPKVAFASVSKQIDLWLLPIDADHGRVTGDLAQLTRGVGTQSTQLSMSANGKRIAFRSDRDGTPQLLIRDLEAGWETAVAGQGVLWMPSLSPDGMTLAWSVFDGSNPQKLFKTSIGPQGQAGIIEPICPKCGPVSSWSPDGKLVVFNKSSPSGAAVLDLTSGNSYEVLARPGVDVWGGRFSPDGQWLTMNIIPSPTKSQIFVAPFRRGSGGPIAFSEWIPITDGSEWDDKPRWSPDSKSIYFISERDGFRCIWWQPLHPATRHPSGPAKAIMHFHEARLSLRNVDIGPLAIQVGPGKLIFSLGELTGNVWTLSPKSR